MAKGSTTDRMQNGSGFLSRGKGLGGLVGEPEVSSLAATVCKGAGEPNTTGPSWLVWLVLY